MKEKILKLRNQGKTYLEISKELRCSKSLVAYYCNNTTKKKSSLARKRNRKKQHPIKRKIENFKHKKKREIFKLKENIRMDGKKHCTTN